MKNKRKSIPSIRLTDEEYNLIQAKKMMMKAESVTETVKRCIFAPQQRTDELTITANQNYINLQKQQHIMFKLVMAILLELTKHKEFLNQIEESKEAVIKKFVATMKQEADKIYK